jgi:glucose/arabinose dehydrogenase
LFRSAIALLSLVMPLSLFAPAATAQAVALTLTPYLTGLDAPVAIANAGDGSDRLFVVERPGRVRVAVGGRLLPGPYLDITDRVHTDNSEQGLLSLAFHPRFAENGLVYLWYTARGWANTLSRFQVDAASNRIDPSTERVLLALPDRAPNHNGGALAFGRDGYLYLSTGDEGGGGDTYANAQDLRSLFGKILRIDVNDGDPYAIPADNPFAHTPGARPEIWAYGLRNPWRFSFDHEADMLYVGDVGQAEWEEINAVDLTLVDGALNFGWNVTEGRHCFEEPSDCDMDGFTLPVAEYDHEEGCAVTAGHVYRGSRSPALRASMLVGDYCSGRIWSLRRSAGGWEFDLRLDSDLSISSFGIDEAGEQYVADVESGAVYHIAAAGPRPAPVLFGATATLVRPGPDALRVFARGEGFVAGAQVVWDGSPLSTTVLGSTQLIASFRGQAPDPGSVHVVTVADPPPGGGTTNAVSTVVSSPVFANGSFQATWSRTDRPVAESVVARTWMWGPGPFSVQAGEPYLESPGQTRAVQYFDKARMELTHPDGDASSIWHVTNGLLVVELVTGRVQIGDDAFQMRRAAHVNVAGDPDDPAGPTYATFSALLDDPPRSDGDAITDRLARDGSIVIDASLAMYGVTAAHRVQASGLDHRVASVFWEFMNSNGTVWDDGYEDDWLFADPYYATGLPITEAYWATVRVGGTAHDVLLQCFERRCLTWTPQNPPGWQVEAGNVGLHHYMWRYGRLP